MSKPLKVAVVGGGITGLSAAYQLECHASRFSGGLRIDLLESSDRLGGKIHTIRQGGMQLEAGAESFLSRKKPGIDLCQELEVAESLRGTRPENKKTFIWHAEKMHRLPEGLTGFVPGNIKSLFSTSLLSLGGKLRVAADYVIPARKSENDESLASFMTRRLGRQAFQRLVQPLLCGIYAADGAELSLAATYPELRSLEKKYGSLIRGLRQRYKHLRSQNQPKSSLPPFVTFPGGMSGLIEAVHDKLGFTQVRHQCPVSNIQRDSESWKLTLDTGETGTRETHDYDAVILTCPAFVAAKITASTNPELSEALSRIPHVSTAAVNLWYDASRLTHPLDGYGFVVPASEQNGITAVTWTSSKHFDRCPADKKLIRVYVGRAGAEADCEMSDKEIMVIVQRELKRFMKIDLEPDGSLIQRWPQGSPQYNLSHPEILQTIKQQLAQTSGVFLCGASYRGVGVPDCIRGGRQAADQAVSCLLKE